MIYLLVTAQGDIPRAGTNYEGVHERSDHHRPQVVGRVRSSILQVLGPHEAEQVQEEPTSGAAVQQV